MWIAAALSFRDVEGVVNDVNEMNEKGSENVYDHGDGIDGD